jgi:hypothetical protein
VEVYQIKTNALRKVILGEVKYTDSVEYAITGLRELMDYMKLVKDYNGTYLDESERVEVAGMLFSDTKMKAVSDLTQLLRFDFQYGISNVNCISCQ